MPLKKEKGKQNGKRAFYNTSSGVSKAGNCSERDPFFEKKKMFPPEVWYLTWRKNGGCPREESQKNSRVGKSTSATMAEDSNILKAETEGKK